MRMRELTDAELVDRFVRQRDEDAYAEIVRRHAPMVYAICHRTLGASGAAEDAVQAVLMLLVRKAGTLSGRSALAGWLHGAARLVAREGVRAARRRKRAERGAAEMRAAAGNSDPTPGDWEAIRGEIDAEIGRLPRHYREAVLLSCVEGRSEAEVARELGVPAGTVKSRVSRGLEKLRQRFAGRGRVMGAAALAALLAEHGALEMPPALAARAAGLGGAGATVATGATGAAGAASVAGPTSACLLMMKGALQAMMMAKLKLAAAVLGAAVVMGTAVPVTRSLVGAAEKTGPAAPPAAAKPVTVVVVRPDGSLVLSAGRKQGVSPGSEFRILRGGTVLATVEVTGFDAAGRAVSAPPRPDPKKLGNNWGSGMLCPGCKRKMFTSDIGKCRNCGRGTSSGSFKLCQACARAGGTCQACGAKFAKPVAAPGPAIRVGDLARPTAADAIVHWGQASNGLQAGLVPLGSRDGKDWAYPWGCSECKRKGRLGTGKLSACRVCKTRKTGASFCCKSCALARRVCAGCGRARPSSATFVAGRPLTFEIHLRNTGKGVLKVLGSTGDIDWLPRVVARKGGAAWIGRFHAPGAGGPGMPVRREISPKDRKVLLVTWGTGTRRLDREPAPRLSPLREAPPPKPIPPGRYLVTFTHRNATRAGHWSGEIVAGPLEIEIRAKGAAGGPAAGEK
jgi:RNA polymerase sigma factor (sigma-70 family)